MRRPLAVAFGASVLLLALASARADEAPDHGEVVGKEVDQEHAEGIDQATTAGEHGGHAEHGAHAAEHGGHAPPPINWYRFDFKDKDVDGGPLDENDEPMAPPFLAALFNFAVFGFLVVKFGGPKVQAYLRERHDTIKNDLAEAARLRSEAAAKLAEYSGRVAKINSEVDQLISEIRADADAEKARILEDARAQAAALRKDADDRIASEFARARLELEREIVAAAVSAAERILRESTTPSDQQALFDGFIATLTPRPAGGTKPPGGTPPAGGGSPVARTDDDISKGWV